MSKEPAKIASAAGISVGGRSDGSKAVENAIRDVVLGSLAAGEAPDAMKEKIRLARANAKPVERR